MDYLIKEKIKKKVKKKIRQEDVWGAFEKNILLLKKINK